VEDAPGLEARETLAVYAGVLPTSFHGADRHEDEEEDGPETMPEARLHGEVREHVTKVLLSEYQKMDALVLAFQRKQQQQFDLQAQHMSRTLHAHEQSLRNVLEATLERWRIEPDGSITPRHVVVTEDKEPNDDKVTVPAVSASREGPAVKEQSVYQPRRHSINPRTSLRGITGDSVSFGSRKKDMIKLKLEFSHKQAALSTMSFDDSYYSFLRGFLENAWDSFVTFCSRKRWNFHRVEALVEGQHFHAFVCAVIVLNAAFLGYSSDFSLRAAIEDHNNSVSNTRASVGTWHFVLGRSPWMFVTEIVFTVLFVLEILLRFLALEGEFIVGEDAGWNLFDTMLTVSSVAEIGLVGLSVDFSYLRVIRIARIIRSFRVFNVVKLVPVMRSLRLMMLAIVKSLIPFVWAVLILLVVMFVFCIIIVHGVIEYMMFDAEDDHISADIRTYLGSLSMTILSLFMSISGGVDWWTVGSILLHISTRYLLIFLIFILFTVLAVMNIITGIFVKEALDMATKDHDMQLQQELVENRHLLLRLKAIFHRMDANSTGCVSLLDFEQTMEDGSVRVLFQQVGLNIGDATSFFKVLDQDDSNELSIEEFVMGCMRFKGGANRMDIEVMLMDTKKLMKKLARMHEKFFERLAKIEQTVGVVLKTLEDPTF